MSTPLYRNIQGSEGSRRELKDFSLALSTRAKSSTDGATQLNSAFSLPFTQPLFFKGIVELAARPAISLWIAYFAVRFPG